MAITLVVRSWNDLAYLKLRAADATPLLKQIGAILVSDAKAAFDRQRLGTIEWPARYPKMKPPFINIAWALKDFGAGAKEPKATRFSPRPAGIGDINVRDKTSFQVLGPDTVEIGNVESCASAMQHGNVLGSIPVTSTVKAGIAAWIGRKRRKGKNDGTAAAKPKGADYAKKLGRFLDPKVTEYRIKGYARPFIGITDETRAYMLQATEDFIATGKL